MQRRDFPRGAGAVAPMLPLAAQAAPGELNQLPTIQWRLASSFPKSLDTIYGAAETLAKRVAELTGGKFQIRVFAGGELVPGLQVLDAVGNGTVECGHSAGYYYVGKNLALAFDTAVPFGLTARQQNAWMYAGGGIEALRTLYAKYNVLQFPGGNTGTQMGGWFRKEIKSLADLKGLKMRIPGVGGRSWRGSAPCRRPCPAATSTRRSNAAHSMPPSGWGRTTTRSSASTRSPSTTTTPAGGKAVRN